MGAQGCIAEGPALDGGGFPETYIWRSQGRLGGSRKASIVPWCSFIGVF
jgi:hypothetical protein